ncbi:hypothetical protein RhiirA5_415573 [Rhizophagus irregularis]|uniref:Uncharacterized protein n=1 Tax=Rhizophagus irregularis TaxID=588596 RepID=A0A2N0PRN3_9GLOM|nr:hypothetical protein RhiirA5_415573 [Rhizophagus irregularis]
MILDQLLNQLDPAQGQKLTVFVTNVKENWSIFAHRENMQVHQVKCQFRKISKLNHLNKIQIMSHLNKIQTMSYISQLETDDSDFNYLPQEYVSRYTKLSTTFTELFINDFEQSEVTESDTGIDDNDDSANNEYSEIFENYLCPPFEPSINTEVANNNQILWILI